MTNPDDSFIKRRISRRETLVLMGGAALAVAVGCGADDDSGAGATNTTAGSSAATATAVATTPAATTATATQAASLTATAAPVSCVITPELTEGPYFVDERLNRSAIRDGQPGVPVTIALGVSEVGDICTPISGATVDMWHCDALGVYSDVSGNPETFLRGYQVTDADGQVQFVTLFPGWYSGRAIHIHFKVRTDPDSPSGREFTSQFFFDEATVDAVLQVSPYNQKGSPDVRNASDNIYRDEMLLPLAARVVTRLPPRRPLPRPAGPASGRGHRGPPWRPASRLPAPR